MKILGAIVFGLISGMASAAQGDYPVGTFLCGEGEKQVTVTVEESGVAGLPYLTYSSKENSGRGIASISVIRGFTSLLISRDFQNNIRFVVSKEGDTFSAGSFGICTKDQ